MTNKILVIDDNAEVRDMLHDLLLMKGYQVNTAINGDAGLEKITAEKPDLVICDIAMPHKDGFAVLEEIRAKPGLEKLPFVFLTASMVRSEEQAVINTTANGYIMKPYDSSKLFKMIDDLLKADTDAEK